MSNERLEDAVQSALVDIDAMTGLVEGTFELTSTDGDTVTVDWYNLAYHAKALRKLLDDMNYDG